MNQLRRLGFLSVLAIIIALGLSAISVNHAAPAHADQPAVVTTVEQALPPSGLCFNGTQLWTGSEWICQSAYQPQPQVVSYVFGQTYYENCKARAVDGDPFDNCRHETCLQSLRDDDPWQNSCHLWYGNSGFGNGCWNNCYPVYNSGGGCSFNCYGNGGCWNWNCGQNDHDHNWNYPNNHQMPPPPPHQCYSHCR